ncbi:hypothetical protein D3C87_1730160 [compost metagenome]
MRSVFQCVVFFVCFTSFNRSDFFSDHDHRINETIDFFFRFRFRWLDHQSSRNREAHCRSMETKVHQAFRSVCHVNARSLFDFTQVDDALMGHKAVFAFVKDREVRL